MSALPDRHQPVLLISLAVTVAALAVLAAVLGLAWVLTA
jgi:hypothetical protein